MQAIYFCFKPGEKILQNPCLEYFFYSIFAARILEKRSIK